MSTQPGQTYAPYRRQAVDTRRVLDVAAVLCLAAGAAGEVVVAFSVDYRLGLASLFALLIILGVLLGLSR